MNNVLKISQLAKTDSPKAEAVALAFVRQVLPQLKAESVQINPSKLSLNSVNGSIMSIEGKYFFKFHTEENETQNLENSEYYNSELLAKYALPVIKPLFTINKPGSQFVVYKYIKSPTAFEEYEKQEMQYMRTGLYNRPELNKLFTAEAKFLEQVRDTYLKSLSKAKSFKVESSQVNQLFYRRLVGAKGITPRLDLYYSGQSLALPDGKKMAFDELKKMQWVINGIEYAETLEKIIDSAKKLLKPDKENEVPIVIGHGDDHNGNKFFIGGKFVLFDAAFAGLQPALLSFVKATAHNSFLHPFWLYDPSQLNDQLKLDVTLKNNQVIVNHNWRLEQASPMRMEILKLQTEIVWKPLIQALKSKGWLSLYWKDYIRKALFCCPLLVLNLIDPAKYTPEQSVLALSKCIELGSQNDQKTLVEKFLNDLDS